MVLDTKQIKENIDIIDSGYHFMVLDSKHLKYISERKKFGFAIEILNFINIINWSNKLCKDLGSKIEIDTEVLHQAIDAVLKNKKFSDVQLKAYYKTMQDFVFLETASLQICDIGNDFDLPYEVDFILFGMEHEEQENMSFEQRNELSEEFGSIYCDNRFKHLEMDSFITQAKKMIAEAKELIEK